ncbi:YeaC family protein [Allohahella sp. A8]|jgi:uncharacterized protein|uniref:YeaC family protein n=1 Tax=Allohahella sp. A8 TaxID=3141461 RepID=UPI000C0AF04B|nr:hypothetical protein [Hahellaceae bacterium]|tara:strand:- start:4459 stop:4725 length:267 start_codon:yes stop_codon:yes gene_type:complete
MDLQTLLKQITPDVYDALRHSLQLGRWPDGKPLTQEQKALCMEAIIRYEHINNFPEDKRTGYVGPKKTSACGTQAEQILTIRETGERH